MLLFRALLIEMNDNNVIKIHLVKKQQGNSRNCIQVIVTLCFIEISRANYCTCTKFNIPKIIKL